MTRRKKASAWLQFTPKFITTMQEGYDLKGFGRDSLAGLTVAIVALPLAMALAIASGTTPDVGLITAVITGFLISALGGSRVQIGGPTGAFIVVVYNVIQNHGYDGLLIATLMAGVMLLIAGVARLGVIMRFMPQPVITGFTAGIALIIFSSQIKDFFGLSIEKVPADFIPKWQYYLENWTSFRPETLGLAAASLALIIILRRVAPKIPAFLAAVVFGSLAVWLFNLPVDTIGSKFGDLPNTLPTPHIPTGITLERMKELLPSAFTIAFLAGIESLLSAVVADGMTGFRHRSNAELLAQGVANVVSPFFGGLPATGAIARTATNIRSNAKTPVAGMMHAVFLLAFMYFLAPLAKYVPLASLSAILIMVAWGMSETEKFVHLLRAPKGDRLVLLLTFGLTALVDLTVAIEAGLVLAAVTFMVRMSKSVEIEASSSDEGEDRHRRASDYFSDMRKHLPKGVEMFKFNGPFFFGAVSNLTDVADQIISHPRVYILDMSNVPMIDASGASALEDFVVRCQKNKVDVVICGLKHQPQTVARRMHLQSGHKNVTLADDFKEAVKLSGQMVA